jgi:hypothetical protein
MKNILLEQGDSNFVQAVVKSVIAGYSNEAITKNIKDLVKLKQASKGVLEASPEAIRVYANNLKDSLEKIADSIVEIALCPETIETDDIELQEDLDAYQKDVEGNKISGVINLNFKQNMTNLRKANRIEIVATDLTKIKQKIFAYLKNEYKTLKADLNDKIFKSNLTFTDLENGTAKVKYEINNAF